MAAPTVISRKQTFIASQTRLLEKPLEPSREWQATNTDAEESLSERLLAEVFYKMNNKLQQHERRVHPQQATRHVAEQINALYWIAAERIVGRDDNGEEVPESLTVFADLRAGPPWLACKKSGSRHEASLNLTSQPSNYRRASALLGLGARGGGVPCRSSAVRGGRRRAVSAQHEKTRSCGAHRAPPGHAQDAEAV